MRLRFDAVSETNPGPKWRSIFAQGWPGWREWQRRKMQTSSLAWPNAKARSSAIRPTWYPFGIG